MKYIVLALSLALPFGSFAQTTTNTPAVAPAAVAPATNAAPKPAMLPEPLSATAPDNTRYLNKPAMTTRCQADLAAIQGKPCDIIFIGDSITAGWQGAGKAIWDKEYVPRHALDFGIGGDKTQNVLWRLDNMPVKDLKPKVAVILIGTNNNNPADEIAAGVKAVVEKTQSSFSGVKIILLTIMPRGGPKNATIAAANKIIKGNADDKSVYLLDLTPLMTPITTTLPDGKTDTNYKGLSKDHLHPDASGYKIWSDAMEPLLTKLLAGQ